MMEIQVVLVNGRLVGRRYQDRHNLDVFGIHHFTMSNIRRQMKYFRKISGGDFIVNTVPGDMVGMTMAEYSLIKGGSKVKAA